MVEDWLGEKKPSYPIVILKGNAFESFLGVSGVPHAAVIGPDGMVTYNGSPGGTGKALSEAVDGAEKGGVWPKKLDKASKLISSSNLDAAYAEVLSLQEGGKLTDEEAAAATIFRDFLEGRAAGLLARARGEAEGGFVYGAVQTVGFVAEASPPFPATEDAKAFLKELEVLPTYQAEMKAGPKILEAEEQAKKYDFTGAFETYKGVAKKYSGSRAAELASTRAQALIDEGKPGMNPSCEECAKAKRACAKHAEEVSL